MRSIDAPKLEQTRLRDNRGAAGEGYLEILQGCGDALPLGRRTAVLLYRRLALCGAVGGVFPEADYGIRLRAFLTLNNVELDLVAFFERFVPVQLNC